MPYYQEGCDVDSFAYDSVLKPNLSSANLRETHSTTRTFGGLGACFFIGLNSPLNKFSFVSNII